jgi:hypothetical protein
VEEGGGQGGHPVVREVQQGQRPQACSMTTVNWIFLAFSAILLHTRKVKKKRRNYQLSLCFLSDSLYIYVTFVPRQLKIKFN